MVDLARRRSSAMKGARNRRRMLAARHRTVEHLADYRGTVAARHWATFLALATVHRTHGRATVRMVQLTARHGSPNTTHRHLLALDDLGLVEVGRPGALRPLFTAHLPIPNPGATA